MNIIGSWKVKKIGIFDEEMGVQMKTIEEIMQMEETEDVLQAKEMTGSMLKISEDGMMRICSVIPPEVIAEAKEQGEDISFNEDGTVTLQKMSWKEENGKIYYNIGIEGEIDGEEIDPWLVAEFDEDGLFVLCYMAFEKM